MNSKNPADAVQKLIQNNPQMQNVMSLYNLSNMSPKAFFYQYAQQNGVDPEQFINSLMH